MAAWVVLPSAIALVLRTPPAGIMAVWTSNQRCAAPIAAEADDVGGAISKSFADLFSNMFKPNAEKEAEIDRAYAEQLEVAERRRNPAAYARKLARTEVNRRKSSEEFAERFAWQKSKDPLAEFKKRLASGKSELSPLIVTVRKQTFPSSRFCLCPRSQKAWVRRRAQGGHPNAHGELWSWR